MAGNFWFRVFISSVNHVCWRKTRNEFSIDFEISHEEDRMNKLNFRTFIFLINYRCSIWPKYSFLLATCFQTFVWLKLNFCLASRWVMVYTVQCMCVWEKCWVDLLMCVPHLLTGVLLTGFKIQQSSLIITNTPIQPITVQDSKHLSFVFIQETCTTEHVECLSITRQKICLVCSCGIFFFFFFRNNSAYIHRNTKNWNVWINSNV